MGKVIGLDYGSKRVGIAITDDMRMIATPLETIHSKDLYEYLKDRYEDDVVEAVVLGYPKGLRGEETDATKQVLDLKKHLERSFPEWKIFLVDERFTSKIASRALIDGGMSKLKRREKGAIDKVSAALILQSFLEQTYL